MRTKVTREGLKEFLTKNLDRKFNPMNGDNCPISVYLTEKTGNQYLVGTVTYEMSETGIPWHSKHRLPKWASSFATEIYYMHRNITGKEALEALEKVS